MSVTYRAVGWNRHKLIYDACVLAAIAIYLGAFVAIAQLLPPAGEAPDPAVTLIRATGSGALVLLLLLLCIGPVARLDTRALPLLYNRRHLGVATFALALVHALVVTVYYHGFGEINPLVSLLVNTSRAGVPFELFGLGALLILFLMAATSHDFWLANLSPRAWKSLHMGVYLAFGLLVLHVAFGVLQSERSPVFPALLAGAILALGALHLVAGRRELAREGSAPDTTDDGWIDAGDWRDIPEGAARVVCPRDGERVAIFRHDGRLSAISNVCAHQQGPLGEGRIIDGCVTCPWHGYQYLPERGESPPPYTEKIPTYELRLRGERVLLNPDANPPGTPVTPARLPDETTT